MAASGGESQKFPKPDQFPNLRIFGISSDGSHLRVAPFARRSGNLPLWTMPLVGGAPRRIGDLTADDATFSPDARQIALARKDGIFLAAVDGSSFRKIASVPGGNDCIAWSPAGKLLRFTQNNLTNRTSLLWEINSQGNNLRRVLPTSGKLESQSCGRWTADGAYYIYTSWETGHGELWVLKEPPAGMAWLQNKPVRLTSSPVFYSDALPAAHGHVIYAFGGSENQVELATLEAESSQPRKLLTDTKAYNAAFSPDGEWLLYVNNEALWRSRPDGRERLQLATNSPQRFIYPPQWSPDSNSILFLEQQVGGDQIYIVSAEGGAMRPVLEPGHRRGWPDWSPDGLAIVYWMEEEQKSPRL